MTDIKPFGQYAGQIVGIKGTTAESHPERVFAKIKRLINPEALIFPFGKKKIQSIGILSGAGHYASEKLGIIALGKLLHQKFNLVTRLIDIYNPV